MPGTTSFLNLTLPELNEFVNSWHTPVNQNMELVDDWLSDLYQSLVGSSSTSTWAGLRGSLASLAARLNVSINDDGTVDLSAAEDLVQLAESKTEGAFSTMHERFEQADFERFNARPGFSDSRFSVDGASIPATAGDYPHAELDVAMAWRARDFATGARQSPPRPWSPGMVSGPANLLTSTDDDTISFQVGSEPAVFNIDGYLFRLRTTVKLDMSAISGIAQDNYVWLYVERDDAAYNSLSTNFQYDDGAKDLRRLQGGTANGSTSGTVFECTAATFQTGIGAVAPGDVLVIENGLSAGSYVVDSVTSGTQLAIKGSFPAVVGGATWYVWDAAHPNLGGAVVADADTLPSAADGRVYVGRCQYRPGGSPTPGSILTFTPNGVYDSGWVAKGSGDLGNNMDFSHNLGLLPTELDVWVRDATAPERIYQPLIKRTLVTDSDPSEVQATLMLPSMEMSATLLQVRLKTVGGAFFTDTGSTDVTDNVEIRVIARR